jgi:hypothetical protein
MVIIHDIKTVNMPVFYWHSAWYIGHWAISMIAYTDACSYSKDIESASIYNYTCNLMYMHSCIQSPSQKLTSTILIIVNKLWKQIKINNFDYWLWKSYLTFQWWLVTKTNVSIEILVTFNAGERRYRSSEDVLIYIGSVSIVTPLCSVKIQLQL